MKSAFGQLALFCALPLIVCSFLVSCSGAHMPIEKAKEGTEGAKGGGATDAPLSYKNGISQIFEKRCTKCHAKGGALPYWGEYKNAFAKKERIFARVVEKKPSSMPPSTEPALSKEEISLIANWIQSGAIEGADSGTDPNPQKTPEPTVSPSPSPSPSASPSNSASPSPSPSPGTGNSVPKVIAYDNYIKGYFASACAMCHDGQTEGLPNWQEWDQVKANLDKIYLRVIKEKDMPMGGLNPMTGEEVTDAERETIKIWLESGALKEPVKY